MSYSINMQNIADELEFDLEDVEMLIGVFLDSAFENLSSLNSAIQEKNFDAIQRFSHSIKGSAGNLLLHDISSIAKEIELNASEKDDIDYESNFNRLNDLILSLKNSIQ